jgi:hypothetical protein
MVHLDELMVGFVTCRPVTPGADTLLLIDLFMVHILVERSIDHETIPTSEAHQLSKGARA